MSDVDWQAEAEHLRALLKEQTDEVKRLTECLFRRDKEITWLEKEVGECTEDAEALRGRLERLEKFLEQLEALGDHLLAQRIRTAAANV